MGGFPGVHTETSHHTCSLIKRRFFLYVYNATVLLELWKQVAPKSTHRISIIGCQMGLGSKNRCSSCPTLGRHQCSICHILRHVSSDTAIQGPFPQGVARQATPGYTHFTRTPAGHHAVEPASGRRLPSGLGLNTHF